MLARRIKLWLARLGLARKMERCLPPAALSVMAQLADGGHEVGLVGGCVRDLLLGLEPKDWDMVTSASQEQILALFPEGRAIGSARGGATVLIPRNGLPYEVTPYRGSGLLGDLGHRDFTINAMALGVDVTLIDPLGGQRDLAAGVVRACGDARERLNEDPLRMLRAVRLAAQFGFAIDPALAAAIVECSPRLAEVAPERIGAEFGRMLTTERPAWAMERLRELELLPHVAPELQAMIGVEQNQYHAYPVWEHSLIALAEAPPVLHIRLAALLHDVGKPLTISVDEQGNRHFYRHEQVGAELVAAMLERLRFDGDTRRRVVHLVRYHMDLHFEEGMSDGAIRRMFHRIGREHMNDLIQLRRADRIASGMREGDLAPETLHLLQQMERILAEDAALKVTDLTVNGEDVMRVWGCSPGPHVGRALERLLAEVLEEPALNERSRLLSRLESLKGETDFDHQ